MRSLAAAALVWLSAAGAVRAQGACELAAPPLPEAACPAAFGASDFVFVNPPCDWVPSPYDDLEAMVIPHVWPLPGGALSVFDDPGLGTCHTRYTVRHTRGRRARGPGAVNLDSMTCAALRRVARQRSATAITIESSSGQRQPERYLRARDVAHIAALGGAQLTLDIAVRRSDDLALLAPLAERIVSLRVRAFRGLRRLDLARLPSLPCAQSLAVNAREVTGLAGLAGAPSLHALEVTGSLEDAEVTAIAGLSGLRELRVYPRGPARIARFEQVRQIARLHTRADARVLEAFRHNRLRRLVLSGLTGPPTLRAIGDRFPDLRELDVALHPSVRDGHVRALERLTELKTLLIAWPDRPPRLPPLPRLQMLVAGGPLARHNVAWINAQPELRTVHSPMLDEVLQPALQRARSYAICRELVQDTWWEPGEGLDGLLAPGAAVTE